MKNIKSFLKIFFIDAVSSMSSFLTGQFNDTELTKLLPRTMVLMKLKVSLSLIIDLETSTNQDSMKNHQVS